MSDIDFNKRFMLKIKKFISERDLLSPGDKIILGFSGGADSVALFKILKELGADFIAVHVNHNLRENAARDENFARDFCARQNARLIVESAKISEYAARKKISTEEAGRELRYFYFNKAARETGANKIAAAHNQNDAVETMLMNFMRGAGLKGLSGIPAKNKNVIRPLLCAPKSEIIKFAGEFVSDETNDMPIFTRNKVRLELIPYIEKNFNPNIIKSLAELSTIYKDEDIFLDSIASGYCVEKNSSIIIDISNLNNAHAAIKRRVVKKALEAFGSPSAKNIDDILNLNRSGKKVYLRNNLTAAREFDTLVIRKSIKPKDFEYDLTAGKPAFIPELEKYILISDTLPVDNKFKNVYTKLYFYDDAPNGLKVRNRRPGDRIRLAGGTKKLKKVFIDDKIPVSTRDSIPLLADGNNILMIMDGKKRESYNSSGIKTLYVQLWAGVRDE
jgi:tRNA(Ile)-lysidine synthase